MRESFKIPDKDEGVLDVMLRQPAVNVADKLHKLNISPNNVTVFRTCIGLLGVYFLHAGNLGLWAVCYFVNYFLDCVDGIMARKYNRATILGDVLDHGSDVILFILVTAVLITKYGLLKNNCVLTGTILVILLNFIQTGRQQSLTKNKDETVLNFAKCFSEIKLPDCLIRNFSAATLTLWIISIPFLLK